jgi:RNase P protein component
MKRRLRMIIASLPIKHQHDFFIITSPYAKTLSFAEIKSLVETLLMKKNLLEVENETI